MQPLVETEEGETRRTPFASVLLVALLALGIFLRLAGLTWGVPPRENAASFYHDEGRVLAMVAAPGEQFRATFGEYEIVRPVYLWRLLGRPLFALGTRLGWNDPETRVYEFAALRFVTALFGIAGLAGVVALARMAGGWAAALWALAFLTVMPGHWYYSQILKGDLLVATLFTWLAVAALRLLEGGSVRWAVAAGVLLGGGVALKPTTLLALPLLLLSFGVALWRSRPRRLPVVRRAALFGLCTLVSFLLLYPYPRYHASRWWQFLRAPTSQSFTAKLVVPLATYRDVWRQYTEGDRQFLTMVAGPAFAAAALPLAVASAVFGVFTWWRQRSWRLLLPALLLLLFLHSLTFTPPLDDRYLVPALPLFALSAGVLAAGVPLVGRRSRVAAAVGTVFGLALFGITAATTGRLFPAFAFRDAREEAVRFLHAAAGGGQVTVAQPSILSRWSLVFDAVRVAPVSLIRGSEQTRHLARLTEADYLAVQRPPWNYDHTFRYDLDGVAGQFAQLVQSYQLAQTFGSEPALFGYRLPRNLGAPVVDVYQHTGRAPLAIERELRAAGPLPVLSARGLTTVVFPTAWDPRKLVDRLVRVRADLSGLVPATGDVRVGLLVLWDGAGPPTKFPDLPAESTFVTAEHHWAWLTHLPAGTTVPETLTIVLDQVRPGLWDIYEGREDRLLPVTFGERRSARRVRFGIVVIAPPEGAGAVELTEAVVAKRAAP